MKKILLSALCFCVFADSQFQREIEHAFLKFDRNNDGLVSRKEMKDAVQEDMPHNEGNTEMEKIIDQMYTEFDTNGDGLDFAELYRASGGNSEDL